MKHAQKGILLCIIFTMFLATACISTHRHIVGGGPQTGQKVSQKQWYALWGLIPLGSVSTTALAGGATDYEIYTRSNAGDFFLNILTGIVTITSRSVTVIK